MTLITMSLGTMKVYMKAHNIMTTTIMPSIMTFTIMSSIMMHSMMSLRIILLIIMT
jgi:hypothetical protein